MTKTTIATIIAATLLTLFAAGSGLCATVDINATGNGDDSTIDITIVGADTAIDISVLDFGTANIDTTNHWGTHNQVTYDSVTAGDIFMRVLNKNVVGNHEFTYYDWDKLYINGDGIYSPGGGRHVEVHNSGGISGWIEYFVGARSAHFIMDTRPTAAVLTVEAYSNPPVEKATVTVVSINGVQEGVTSTSGTCAFDLSTGEYKILIAHENFSTAFIEAPVVDGADYYLSVNMTDGEYVFLQRDRGVETRDISTQEYVNYYAEQITQGIGADNQHADGILGLFAEKYGIDPDPGIGAVLYDYEITKNACNGDTCSYLVNYTLKNYQLQPHWYEVSLIAGNGKESRFMLGAGRIGTTFNGMVKGSVFVDLPEYTTSTYLVVNSGVWVVEGE